MKVYSIVAFDNANDVPPRTSVFASEDEAVQSVVDEVSQFASLHEVDGDFSLGEIPDTLKDGYVYEFVSGDGFTYSWRMQSHTLIADDHLRLYLHGAVCDSHSAWDQAG